MGNILFCVNFFRRTPQYLLLAFIVKREGFCFMLGLYSKKTHKLLTLFDFLKNIIIGLFY